jgi:hypothetical protein
LKNATVEAGTYFYDLKTAAAIIFISNPNLRFRYGFGFALGLPNGLRITCRGTGGKMLAVDYLTCVNNLKARTKPEGQVHALLGGV